MLGCVPRPEDRAMKRRQFITFIGALPLPGARRARSSRRRSEHRVTGCEVGGRLKSLELRLTRVRNPHNFQPDFRSGSTAAFISAPRFGPHHLNHLILVVLVGTSCWPHKQPADTPSVVASRVIPSLSIATRSQQ